MAGAALELDLRELRAMNEQIAAGLKRLAAADEERLLGELGVTLEGQAKERFEAQRGPSGKGWEPWSERYRTRRAGDGGSILRRPGQDLFESITHEVAGGKLRVGSAKAYAAVHQYGHTFTNAFGRGISAEVPERPYLDTEWKDEQAVAELGQTLEEWVREQGGEVIG